MDWHTSQLERRVEAILVAFLAGDLNDTISLHTPQTDPMETSKAEFEVVQILQRVSPISNTYSKLSGTDPVPCT